jgi:hypothetical protein
VLPFVSSPPPPLYQPFVSYLFVGAPHSMGFTTEEVVPRYSRSCRETFGNNTVLLRDDSVLPFVILPPPPPHRPSVPYLFVGIPQGMGFTTKEVLLRYTLLEVQKTL